MTLSRVWQPLTLGSTQVKNRMVLPARTTNWSDGSFMSARHLSHLREIARGGTGLIITEQHAAHPISKGSFMRPCTAWESGAIEGFEELAGIAAENDTRALVQLFGAGANDKGTMLVDEWHPLWGVSEMPSLLHGESPMVMDGDQVRDVVSGFARSAANAQRGGLDGVEIHGAHDYLVGQFLNRFYNRRSDEYGGSLENRCRFVAQIGEAVRESVGSDLVVGLRLSYDTGMGPLGITPEDADEQVDLIAGLGIFDYFSISAGGYHRVDLGTTPMSQRTPHLLHLAERAKRIIGDRAAVIGVGNVRDLHVAEDALERGQADLIAMGRAHFADPHIVRKTKENRENEVIRCTGANECIGRLFQQQYVICGMNPATGRERQWGPGSVRPVEPDEAKSVMVIGGGPAGMQVAALAAERGHRVVLFEGEQRLGGTLNFLARFPGRQGWETAVDNLQRRVEAAGVDVRLGEPAAEATVRDQDPDLIVVATGSIGAASAMSPSRLDSLDLPGGESERVMTIRSAAERALDDPLALGRHVVIHDETGGNVPLNLAVILARAGAEVEVVSPRMYVGEETAAHLEMPELHTELVELGVPLNAQARVSAVTDSGCTVSSVWGGDPREVPDVSAVVLAAARQPQDDLYRQLAGIHDDVRRVGDCLAPRNFAAVMYDAEKLGREL